MLIRSLLARSRVKSHGSVFERDDDESLNAQAQEKERSTSQVGELSLSKTPGDFNFSSAMHRSSGKTKKAIQVSERKNGAAGLCPFAES
jgi:hypothetical protein